MNAHNDPAGHPADERLAALAGADPDATADPALRDHVAACGRCREVTEELTRLRAVLAELPEVAPPSRLRPFALPAAPPRHAAALRDERAEPSFGGRFLDTLRGALTPAMVAGAALALLGAVGMSGYLDDAASRLASGPAPDAAPQQEAAQGGADSAGGDGAEIHPEAATPTAAAMFSEPDEATRTDEVDRDVDARELVGEGEWGGGNVGFPWLAILVLGGVVAVGALALRLILPRSSA